MHKFSPKYEWKMFHSAGTEIKPAPANVGKIAQAVLEKTYSMDAALSSLATSTFNALHNSLRNSSSIPW